MSDYIVSARKYRPTSFDAVVGQKALTTTLKNAIAGGKLAHAYLFCGPRGVGKTTSARIFAKTINCLNPTPTGEACDACESCVAFNEGRSYNIHELDAASNNSVDDIRELIEQVQIPPQVGRYKVFIIDEVHMLSQAAFNAFLKTLEEPPAHAIFILATTEKHKILPTILSRCQIYDFNRMEVPETVAHLKHVAESEGIKYEEEALNVIARKADGGMRDALSIFDQVASFTNGNITYAQTIENLNVLDYDYYFEVTDRLLEVDIPQVMLLLDKVLNKGFEAGHFIGGLAAHFRDLLVSRDAQTLPLLEVAESVRARYAEQAARCTPRFLYAALKLCNDCDINYRTAPNKRLLVELTLIQVAQLLQQEDVPPSGRRPTLRLLPIFKPAADQVPMAGAPQQKTSAPPSANVGPASPAMTPTAVTTPAAPRPMPTPRTAQQQLAAARLQTVSLTRKPQPATSDGTTIGPATSTNSTTPTELRYEAFTVEQLEYLWMRFANELPPAQLAEAGRLKMIRPQLGEAQRVVGVVENEAAAAYLNKIVPQLTAFLRRELHNDGVTVVFAVSTERREKKRVFSPREIFRNMVETNEAFRQLAIELQLELN